ncbi:MAG TPA: DUF362 domain-containing protein [Chloroflexota bacterium]|nr:DUF362 domain-containing protein [Chloroflexota bacterium]
MSRPINRRRFLRNLLLLGAGYGILPNVACSPSGQAVPTPAVRLVPTAAPTSTALSSPAGVPNAAAVATIGPTVASTVATSSSQLVVARGSSPEAITRSAIETLGGMSRFVKPGAEVIVKPNICVANYSFEYAATTNPEVVGTIVKLCVEAGAKRVRVMDFPFGGTAEQAYVKSGIGDAARAAGGQMETMSSLKYGDVAIPNGRDIKTWKIYRDAVDPNVVLINVPIVKHHSLAGVTIGMKNLMGLIQDRGGIHTNMDQRLPDLLTVIRPTLTVVDAVRILTRNGPTGGNLADVKKLDTVVASADPVAADSYGATLFGRSGSDLGYIRNGAAMGLGVMDLSQVAIKEVTA